MADVKALMKEKIKVLDEASKAYYARGEEIMSNFEYDKIYDELVELEKQSGIILAGSPTQKVGYEILSELLRRFILRGCFRWIRLRAGKNSRNGLEIIREFYHGS